MPEGSEGHQPRPSEVIADYKKAFPESTDDDIELLREGIMSTTQIQAEQEGREKPTISDYKLMLVNFQRTIKDNPEMLSAFFSNVKSSNQIESLVDAEIQPILKERIDEVLDIRVLDEELVQKVAINPEGYSSLEEALFDIQKQIQLVVNQLVTEAMSHPTITELLKDDPVALRKLTEAYVKYFTDIFLRVSFAGVEEVFNGSEQTEANN